MDYIVVGLNQIRPDFGQGNEDKSEGRDVVLRRFVVFFLHH